MLDRIHNLLQKSPGSFYPHLDSKNSNIKVAEGTDAFLRDPENMPVVSANAYLGMRGIKRALEAGADIVICGRCADASPVIAAAAWWHGWADDAWDELAGAFTAGHLIECSTYVTGANFSGWTRYPLEELLGIGLGIAEVDKQGNCVITKHDALPGVVHSDTVKSQLLYELQGHVYLNSDVKADLSQVSVEDIGKNRVMVTGTKGHPPPPTTKLAVFYRGGYQWEWTVNTTGKDAARKFKFQEMQLRRKVEEWGMADDLEVLDFQHIGVPATNPDSQFSSTTYIRMYAQSKKPDLLNKLTMAWVYDGMAHFAGMHLSLLQRGHVPKPFLSYYPALIPQDEIDEAYTLLGPNSTRVSVGSPPQTEELAPRANYETLNPAPLSIFGDTFMAPLGEVAHARSGDKGANVNIGIFVHTEEEWEWLRSFLTHEQMRSLMGKDWQPSFYTERVEFPHIKAVHFVVYGALGQGVSSSRLLDGLGKGFAEFIRAVHVPIPKKFLLASAS